MNAPVVAESPQLDLFTAYPVKIEIFEGPLDLLLHLVKQEEVDIYEVEIAQITQQYLDYIDTMQAINIAVAGDFLVLAATLMYIKSRRLLPPTAEEEEQEPDEAELVVKLRQQMAQYRAFKQAAVALNEARQLRQQIYLRSLQKESEIASGFVRLEDVSIFDMVGAVRKLLQQAEPESPGQVERPPVTLGECIQQVTAKLHAAQSGSVTFAELVDLPATRTAIIFTFLSILELIRRRHIRVHQDRPGAEIVVGLTPESEEFRPATEG